MAGAAVKLSEDKKCTLFDLTVADLKSLHPAFEDDVLDVWSYEKSVENRSSLGGTSRSAVMTQLEQLREWLSHS